jgi:hypothetical protein
MWPVYSGVLRETLARAVSADEAATIAAALERTTAAASPRGAP